MRIALIGIHPGFDQTIEEIDAARSGGIEIELLDVLRRRGLALRHGVLKADETEADGKRNRRSSTFGSITSSRPRPECVRFLSTS
jgi:hypothetical protein